MKVYFLPLMLVIGNFVLNAQKSNANITQNCQLILVHAMNRKRN